MEREKLGSRLGFILISAGCAIGIGNVWRFPYLAGQNGGGAFVIIYLICLAILGIPVLAMEFSVGRAAQRSPIGMYQPLEPAGSKWHLHGYFALAGNYLLMMFYTTVAGWMLIYFAASVSDRFEGLNPDAVAASFTDILANPAIQVGAMAIVVAVGFFLCAQKLQKGLERVTKIMMTMLIIIMIILAVHSLFLDGAGEGIAFYLFPDFAKVGEIGVFKVVAAAMNQAFFTLSIGIGSMAIFGSYIGKEHSLFGEAVNVTLLDTFVAFFAGLIIIPACFAYGVEPGSGPGLLFITLPNIFNNMPLGRLWGSLFFIFMTFAAFSTVFAVFENIMACTMELKGWNRKKASLINGVLVFLLSLPCALGFSLLSGIHPMGGESSFLDLEDFIVSNLMLPIGSLIFVLFCVSRFGWGWNNFIAEVNTGEGIKIKSWMRPYLTFVLPVIVFAILALGLVDFFSR